jgi:DNA-binding MarR family transcriptional regulator/GNAT superfamily N-acetyltransferase
VLWEIGDTECDVRALRARLCLDSGYLSRLLRSLETAGLVTVVTGASDTRVRTARLTRKGARERAVLDRRSDTLARSMLDPLTDAQRECLVRAMKAVDQLLTVALIEIDEVDPTHHLAQHCLREYFAELDRRFDTGFDPDESLPAVPEEMRPPNGVFLVATLRGEPVGCGALKFHGAKPTEVKRMWVSPSVRGLGVGRRLLGALERLAIANESHTIRLDTNATLTEAIAMYRSAGYREVKPFNNERYANHWFQKRLLSRR